VKILLFFFLNVNIFLIVEFVAKHKKEKKIGGVEIVIVTCTLPFVAPIVTMSNSGILILGREMTATPQWAPPQ